LIGKERRLYKIKISEDIMYYSEISFFALRNKVPYGKPRKGIIKKGTTGEIIKKWGKKYFSPDCKPARYRGFYSCWPALPPNPIQ
jgi:hypothetical protein